MKKLIISVRCPDQPGIIAHIANTIYHEGGNILQADQHSTSQEKNSAAIFYMRLVFEIPEKQVFRMEEQLEKLAQKLSGEIKVYHSDTIMRMGILVSKLDHCLADILYRKKIGEFSVEIPLVIGNHRDCEDLAKFYGIPFYFVDMKNRPKEEAEQEILKLVKDTDFLVLARFMQILSKNFLDTYQKDIINIHHSFLPSFKGAHPYRQAFEKGVKVIGATAHFVTEDLDEGPIIEQVVERVTHKDSEADLKRKGRNLEVLALASAIKAYLEHRVIRHGNKTIVFQ